MRPSCTLEAFHAAWEFAERYDMTMQIDLVHYSLPYFTEGPEHELQFRPEDRPAVEAIVRELLRLKAASPGRFRQSPQLIRSIPDWLMLGPAMQVPCSAYELLWVGADGTVQMCYVTFKLGNLHESRLRDMLYTKTHACAARDAFALKCPGCHCDANSASSDTARAGQSTGTTRISDSRRPELDRCRFHRFTSRGPRRGTARPVAGVGVPGTSAPLPTREGDLRCSGHPGGACGSIPDRRCGRGRL